MHLLFTAKTWFCVFYTIMHKKYNYGKKYNCGRLVVMHYLIRPNGALIVFSVSPYLVGTAVFLVCCI